MRFAIGYQFLCALSGFRSQRWFFPVRGIDDQRCAIVELAVDYPEVIVVARRWVIGFVLFVIRKHRRVYAVAERGIAFSIENLDVAAFEFRDLCVGQLVSTCECVRPFQRRCAVVGPYALQVRGTVGRSWRLPSCVGGLGSTRGLDR